jgi:hypothetical protein
MVLKLRKAIENSIPCRIGEAEIWAKNEIRNKPPMPITATSIRANPTQEKKVAIGFLAPTRFVKKSLTFKNPRLRRIKGNITITATARVSGTMNLTIDL